jgi:hypothetical protein
VVLIRSLLGAQKACRPAKRHCCDSHSLTLLCRQVWAGCGHATRITQDCAATAAADGFALAAALVEADDEIDGLAAQ